MLLGRVDDAKADELARAIGLEELASRVAAASLPPLPRGISIPQTVPQPEPAALEAALDLILEAQRPLVIGGKGAGTWHDGGDWWCWLCRWYRWYSPSSRWRWRPARRSVRGSRGRVAHAGRAATAAVPAVANGQGAAARRASAQWCERRRGVVGVAVR